MQLLLAKCTMCGEPLRIDSSGETAICDGCGSTFLLCGSGQIRCELERRIDIE